eukprot:86856_1
MCEPLTALFSSLRNICPKLIDAMQSLQLIPLSTQHQSIDELKSLHESMLFDGYNNRNKEHEIIEIIGGIDKVLSHYLSSLCSKQNSLINESQIQLIHKTLSNNYSDLKQKIKPNQNIQISSHNNFQEQKLHRSTITLDPYDNYLNHTFGSNIGPKLHQIIYHKIILSMIFLVPIYFVIFNYLYNMPIFMSYSVVVFTLIWEILIILSVNRHAFCLVLRSFEYWIKMYYAFVLGLAGIIYVIKLEAKAHILLLTLLRDIAVLLSVMIFSIMDGLNWPRKSKIIISIIFSLAFSIATFFLIFFLQDNDISINITNFISIGLVSMMANSMKISFIFILKQTIKFSLKKDKATIINYSPYIFWISTHSSYQLMT